MAATAAASAGMWNGSVAGLSRVNSRVPQTLQSDLEHS
jgi:hypothetical protein